MREIVERAESKCLTPSPSKCSDTFLESSPEGPAIEEQVVPHCADTQLDEETATQLGEESAWETQTLLYDPDGLDLALEASAARPLARSELTRSCTAAHKAAKKEAQGTSPEMPTRTVSWQRSALTGAFTDNGTLGSLVCYSMGVGFSGSLGQSCRDQRLWTSRLDAREKSGIGRWSAHQWLGKIWSEMDLAGHPAFEADKYNIKWRKNGAKSDKVL